MKLINDDINDQIMPCEKCDDLIAIGKGHVSRIEQVGPNLKGVWYSHTDEADCTPQTSPVQKERAGFGKPYVEVDVRESNVIQTEFTVLEVMLRRVREANPKEIVIIYDIATEEDDRTRVSWVGVDRKRIVGMLTGAAMDVWTEPEKTVRTVGPGDSG